MTEVAKKIEKLVSLILNAQNVVALTGAGMSTESGIADFRSPGTGLWETVDPYEFASIDSYAENAGKNIEKMLELGLTIFRAKPNAGHKALTKLQKLGKLNGVITQNIDRLHQKAHTQNVVELHGNVMESICMECGKIYPITTMVNQALKNRIAPVCEACEGCLKPNAVFFGEMLPADALSKADELVANCDLLLILGSSLVVYPAALYPRKALTKGVKLAILNIQETDIDDESEVVIHDKIGEIFPKIVDLVATKLKK